MSDDFDKKLKQLSEILNDEEAQQGLKNLIGSLGGGSDDSSADSGDLALLNRSDGSELNALLKAKDIINKINTTHDSRMDLLYAIKPFLSTKRKDRCNTCVSLLRIASNLTAVSSNDNIIL